MNTEILTVPQLKSLDAFIQTQLLKRGYTAPILKLHEVEHRTGAFGIHMETSPFQTTPVMFKSVSVKSFNSQLKRELISPEGRDNYDKFSIWMTINVAWESFSGGTNCTELFEFNAHFINEDSFLHVTGLR